jgi:general transcription factor 3C polypeptide 3 (transcription factor C subunit 4)
MASPDLYSYEYPDPTQAGSSTWTADSNPHLEPEDQQTNTGPVIHQGFIQDDNYDLGPRHENRPISAARNRRHIQPTQHSRPSDNISNGEGRFDSEEDEEQYLRHRALSDDSLVDEDYEFSDRSADEEVDGAEETEDDSENSNNEEESGHYALEAEVANLKQSFQRPEEEEDINKGLPKHRRGRPGRRGPREAAKLSQETRALLGEANSAFIAGRYEEAEELANDILVKNNEIYAAYMLLSEIQLARDDTTASLVTMITAAHLRPREPALWHTIASRCLQRTGRSRRIWINQAIYCLNQVLRLDNRDFSTRMERAALYHELGQTKKIAREYDFMLKSLPHDLAILRAFGEICLERKEFERGKKYYQAAFEHYKARAPDDESETISWVDINIYSQLIAGIDGCAEAIFQLKSLSRGLLRRGEETYWDDIQEDDCEWDAEDRPRRVEVPGYDPERFHLESYGLGMPLELRMKLGVFRLQQGQQYSMEALVSHLSNRKDNG